MQFHTAKLFLHQVAFFERNLQQSPALHIPMLTEGLSSAKAFLDLYLWLPPKSEMALTNAEWVQLSFGLTQAAKFALVAKAPNVEHLTREARQHLDIDHVFRHLTLRIGALVGRAGEKNKDIFFYYETRVRKIQNWYENMSRATGSDSPGSARGRSALASSAGATPPAHSPYSSHTPEGLPLQQHQYQQTPASLPLPYPHQHQHPLSWTPPPAPVSDDVYQAHRAALGIGHVPMNTYGAYSPVPAIEFPDLMSAPGWDTLFAVPMEDTSWFADEGQAYGGTDTSSPHPSSTEGGWRDPGGS
jgi:hypothetical protein